MKLLNTMSLVEMESYLREMVMETLGKGLKMDRRQFQQKYDVRGTCKQSGISKSRPVPILDRKGRLQEVSQNYGVQCGMFGGNTR